jgi:hypothetical protein
MRNNQEGTQHRLDSFNAIYGNISKNDLKVLAASAMQLQHIDGTNTTTALRELQLFLSCQFVLFGTSPNQKEGAMRLLKIIHTICTELEWQATFSLSLID